MLPPEGHTAPGPRLVTSYVNLIYSDVNLIYSDVNIIYVVIANRNQFLFGEALD